MKDPKTADTLRRLRELALRRMVRNGDAAALDELLRLAAGGALALPAPPTLQGTLDLYPSLAELVAEIDPKHVSTRWEAHTDAQGSRGGGCTACALRTTTTLTKAEPSSATTTTQAPPTSGPCESAGARPIQA